MLPDDLAVTEIMILMNEAVVEGLKFGMSYQRDSDGRKISKFPGDEIIIDGKNLGAFVSAFIPAIVFSRREDKMSHTFQGEEKLPAGHVFGGAVGLEPSPVPAQDSGDAFSSLGPMFIDHPLNHGDVGFRNGSFSYGYWQHDKCISEEEGGRQQKMQGSENIFSGEFLPGNSAGWVGR